VLGGLEEVFGLPGGGSRRARVGALAELLTASRPRFVTIAPEQSSPAALFDEAVDLVDQLPKIQAGAVLTLLLLRDVHSGAIGDSFDYTIGEPADSVLQVLAEGQDAAWRAYLHVRAAWEAGGRLSLARRFEAKLFESRSPLVGDDALVERGLNKAAAELWESADMPTRGALLRYLEGMTAGRASEPRSIASSKEEEQLRRAGLLWNPAGSGSSLPCPWVARGLLLRSAEPTASMLLRSVLVCALLARDVLTRCFDLEMRARLALSPAVTGSRPSAECEGRFAAFVSRSNNFESSLYPLDCPAVPRSAWAFASFGEFTRGAGQASERSHPLTRLRLLRNAIAHGHYVGWRAVSEVLAIEKQLALS